MSAAMLFCMVISVTDGDTLKVTCPEKITVRLAQIDAPEKRQDYGKEAKASLSSLCLGKPAEVVPEGKDRYRRTIAQVSCAGVDASFYQVQEGAAWVYKKYAHDALLYDAEAKARDDKRGLWGGSPVPPWEWRKKHFINNGYNGGSL